MTQTATENKQIVEQLTHAYWMELETVQNYLANSVNLIGVRARQISQSLADDVNEELAHARQLAQRIHILGGQVPGSADFHAEQQSMQPSADPTDVLHVIRGVLEAEQAAIDQYNKLIKLCDGRDYVTQDLCIALLAEEEAHRREFLNYLAEYEK